MTPTVFAHPRTPARPLPGTEPGHGQDHGAHIAEEGHPDVGSGSEEPQPIEHTRKPRTAPCQRLRVRQRRDRGQPEQPPQGRGEQGDVHRVGQLITAPVDQEAGHQRPNCEGEVEGEDAERTGRREEMTFQQPRVDGRTGRADHSEARTVESHQQVENQRVGVAQPCLQRGEDARGPHDHAGHAGHAGHHAPLVRVDQRPAITAP
jgi:hypothetical protein